MYCGYAHCSYPLRLCQEMDFYNASTLLPLSDDALKRRLLDTYLPPLVSPGDAKITDVSVARFRWG